jgi:pimeloyl-ACP methyl ester carboxylesterase
MQSAIGEENSMNGRSFSGEVEGPLSGERRVAEPLPKARERAPASTSAQRSLPAPMRAVRLIVKALEHGSPALVARVLCWLMFRTRRSAPHERERELLRDAERWELAGPRGRLAAFRFGRGPAVILVHGWNGRGSQLAAFVPPLVSAGYQVVAFDAPGHGESFGSEASLVMFADAFERVATELALEGERVHGVIAHSLGGAAVTFAESRRLRSPARGFAGVGRLVFVAPPIDLRDWIEEFCRAFGVSDATAHMLRGLVQARVGHRLSELSAADLAREMLAPLLVLHDEQDGAVPLSNAETLVAAWPNAALVKSSGLGHVRILRDELSVSRAVAFIRGE